MKKTPILSVISSVSMGKSNLIKFILSQNLKNVVVFDGKDESLVDFKNKYDYYNIASIEDFVSKLDQKLFDNHIIVTDSGDDLIKNLSAAQSNLVATKLTNNSINLVVAYNANVLREHASDITRILKNNIHNIVQLQLGDQNVVNFDYNEKKEKLKIGDVVFTNGVSKIKARVPKIGGGN